MARTTPNPTASGKAGASPHPQTHHFPMFEHTQEICQGQPTILEDPSKRGSDSLLNANPTASSKSHQRANRAQSLDLTLAFSRLNNNASTESAHHLGQPHSSESNIGDYDTVTPSPTGGVFPSSVSVGQGGGQGGGTYPYPHSHSQSMTTLSVSAGPGAAGVMAGYRQAQSIDAGASEHADIAQITSGLKEL
ncbi:hypothetical protein M422DRAFT_32422 [Sphaerobolus stellatus SS14]|uniref:Uncharacterized protein n=1 Tax=Sphaerobolus stellatus (strain SS14) TaxID=990650 RepID=A0A0C9UAP2_SPHS4|nr:hypothetical protein M422DRAFT_32422 [Sphaerobolus stellatus SS14]